MNYDNLNGNNLKSRSKSSLFLMELIIVLLFFSLSAATCMQVFAQAKVKTDKSSDMSGAAFACESIAESYKAYEGDLDILANKYKANNISDGVIELYYDEEWDLVTEDKANFVMTVTETESDSIDKAFIEVDNAKGECVFEVVSTVLAVNVGEEAVNDAK